MRDNDFYKILDTVLRLEVTKGHLRWKISDLSRLSGIQRTLIYYYFGKSKESILKTAMKVIGDEFFGLSPKRVEVWRQGRIYESIQDTRDIIAKAPHVLEFYFHWRHKPSPVQDELKALEKRYLLKLKEFFPDLQPLQRQAIYTVFFGLATIPDLDPKVRDQILALLPRRA